MRLIYANAISTRLYYSTKLLLLLLLLSCCSNLATILQVTNAEQPPTIETIIFTDSNGVEHEEYAFRAPMDGLPEHPLKMFCASTKMRLYWSVFREEIKQNRRKSINLRRMARLAKHVFEDARDADKPFNATMLSKVDKYFAASIDTSPNNDGKKTKCDTKLNLKNLKCKLTRQKTTRSDSNNNDFDYGDDNHIDADKNKYQEAKNPLDLIDSSDWQSEDENLNNTKERVKTFIKKHAPKVALGIYTRWRTVWWMMLSCLFTKYYLWDPALDEFTKLKRSLVMWPKLQLVKLQDLQCKPLKLFKRILDVCKILNPLLHFSFGQLSLDRPYRFKGDLN